MPVLMKISPVGLPVEWKYLKAFNVDDYDGRGSVVATEDITRAHRFTDMMDAFIAWRQQSKVKPFRPDGKPNRPLTSFHATFETVDQ